MSEHDFIIWLKGFISGTNPITRELTIICAVLKEVECPNTSTEV